MAIPPLAINLAVDVAAAGLTAAAVAPLCSVLDEGITRAAAGGDLWSAIGGGMKNIVTKPVEFLGGPAFQWMWLVYAATYSAANSLKSIQAAWISLGFIAVITVAVVNTCVGIAKDSAYSQLFGCDDDGCVITPRSAYITWFMRDLVAFSFILSLPIPLAAALGLPLGMVRFLTPVLAQYLTTPLHLLGLSFCNNFDATFGVHLKAMSPKNFFSMVSARQLKIIPPYSIGGLLNAKILSLAPALVAA